MNSIFKIVMFQSGNLATPLVNALPRTYYTTSDSGGPDSNVCCMFDLGPSARSHCSKRANDVNDQNVEQYAESLTSQYRELSHFYLGNTVLVPVGDDFFYSKNDDWTITYENYNKIFNYVNSHPEKFKMNVKFSTVEEYFKKVAEKEVNVPLFTGDFFPYTENKHGSHPYWTGFYVHRPFFKRAERLTEVIILIYTQSCSFTALYTQLGNHIILKNQFLFLEYPDTIFIFKILKSQLHNVMSHMHTVQF